MGAFTVDIAPDVRSGRATRELIPAARGGSDSDGRFALDFGRENPPLSRFNRVAGGSAGAESSNSAIVRSQVCVTAQAASYGVGAITTLC